MFDLLDKTLEKLLDDPLVATPFPDLYNADVSFVTPEKPYNYGQETLNLFLYDTKENRELREAAPVLEQRNGMSIRRRPPLRVDCTYLVTAWSKQAGAAKVAAEHRLLGQALNWLSRFPEIPEPYLAAGGLANQVFAPPTLVAQMDPVKSAGEFWSALGIPPRPFFNLLVTVEMDLDNAFEAPIVTTLGTSYHVGDAAAAETRFLIGGTVYDNAGAPVPRAWVQIEPGGPAQFADAVGRFIFADVQRRTGLTLRAHAPGLGSTARAGIEIPSVSRDYDLKFP